MKQVSATVIENKLISAESHYSLGRLVSKSQLIWLGNCTQITSEARPGQFVMVRCGKECILPRPFSVHQVDGKGDMALFFAVWENGKGTNWLSQRKAGDNIDLFGPLGDGYSIYPTSHNLLLVAGGVGIAPLHFLAQEAQRRQCSVTLLHGASKATHLYPEDMPTGTKIVTLTEDGSEGQRGMITDVLPKYADWADQVFACGPTPMYRDMALKKQELKLEGKPVQISLEVMMGCGLGVCYGCTLKTRNGLKQVCKDGPVFELDDILWDELPFER